MIQSRRNGNNGPADIIADIIELDQAMVQFDMPEKRTNDVKGAKTVRIKTTNAEKRGFTDALVATARGVKLPAAVIFRERDGILGVRVRRKLCIPNVLVSATRNSCMTRPEYQRWLRRIFGPPQERRGLLIVDRYPPHLADDSTAIVRNECNSDVLFIPGGCTDIV